MNEDRRFRLISRVIDGFVTLARSGFVALIVISLGRYARDVLIEYAGKETAANLALSLIVNLQADRWVAYLVRIHKGQFFTGIGKTGPDGLLCGRPTFRVLGAEAG